MDNTIIHIWFLSKKIFPIDTENFTPSIRLIRYLLLALCVLITMGFIAFAVMHGEYLNWDYSNPEYAVAGTILHGVEFLFVRLAPFALIGSIIGIIFTYKNR